MHSNVFNLSQTYTDKGWSGMILLVVDYTQPWALLERLEYWVAVLDSHIESLKVQYISNSVLSLLRFQQILFIA